MIMTVHNELAITHYPNQISVQTTMVLETPFAENQMSEPWELELETYSVCDQCALDFDKINHEFFIPSLQ